jgi:hypothetical protein
MFLDFGILVYFGVVVVMFLPNYLLTNSVTWHQFSCCFFVDLYFRCFWKQVCSSVR